MSKNKNFKDQFADDSYDDCLPYPKENMFQSELSEEDESMIQDLTEKLKMSKKIDYMRFKIECLEQSITELKKSNTEIKHILKVLASSINPSLDFKDLEQNKSPNYNTSSKKSKKSPKYSDDIPF